MKFKLLDHNYSDIGEREINTLEDLEKLQEEYDNELIVNFKEKSILIYDGYIE